MKETSAKGNKIFNKDFISSSNSNFKHEKNDLKIFFIQKISKDPFQSHRFEKCSLLFLNIQGDKMEGKCFDKIFWGIFLKGPSFYEEKSLQMSSERMERKHQKNF